MDVIDRLRHALQGDLAHEFFDLRLAIPHFGATRARKTSRLLFAQHHGALFFAGGIAGRGLDLSFQDEYFGRAALVGDHAELGSQVHDIDAWIRDTEADG